MEKPFEKHTAEELTEDAEELAEDKERTRDKERYEQEPLFRRGVDAKKLLYEAHKLLESTNIRRFSEPEVIKVIEELGNRVDEFEKTNNLHWSLSPVIGGLGWLKEIPRLYDKEEPAPAKRVRNKVLDCVDGIVAGINLMLDEGVKK